MLKTKQKQKILNYMREKGSITPMAAFGELGITKLATRVGELIQDGYDIQKVWETDVNRDGDRVRYMSYHLISDSVKATA